MGRPGYLISVEGVDGAGKSTQVAALASGLAAAGIAAITVRPEGTSLGVLLQQHLLEHRGGIPVEPWAEALLFTAGRVQLLRESILPALERGQVIIADRFSDSTLAYQGGGRGLDVDILRRLQDEACRGVWPDLTILLTVPPAEASRRQRESKLALDRFETALDGFQDRVGACFTALAEAEPERFLSVDASRAVGVVSVEIIDAVRRRISARR